MQGNSKSKKTNDAKSGKFKTKGKSLNKSGSSYSAAGKSIKSMQTSAAKTSIGEVIGRVGVAANSTGGSKLKGSQAASNGLSKNVGGPAINGKSSGLSKRAGGQTTLNSKNMSVTSGKSSGAGSGSQKSISGKSGCSKSMPTKTVNDKSDQSKSAKSQVTGSKANTSNSSSCGKQSQTKTTKTKVLVKAKVKKIKKLSQVKSTGTKSMKDKMTNSASNTCQAKLTSQASSSSSTTTPVKSSSSSSKSSSVAIEYSHDSKLSEKKEAKRDSWLYRCLDAYDHGGQSGTFEPFFLTESIVIKHSQSELNKLVDIDSALCDRAEMAQLEQQQPPTGTIKSTSHAVHNGPSTEPGPIVLVPALSPPPKMSLAKKIATGGVNKFEPIMEIGKAKVEEKQPPADRKRRNDRRAEQNSAPEPKNLLVPGVGILERAQRATLTRFNRKVHPGKQQNLITLQEQNAIRSRPLLPPTYVLLFGEPYNQLSTITELLGLTGVGGIIKERLEQFPRQVACVINVTHETPLLQVNGIESYRIPVEDDHKEQLSMYFDEVLDKMYSFESKGLATVVHCMAGVSRSASIVIAYLIRYHQKSLEEAFRHTKAARDCINPNMGFLEQLERFESANRTAEQCTPWRDHTINQQTRRLPLFIITDYLEEYEHVFDAPIKASRCG